MKIASEADNFPTKTLLKFDDHQNQKSAYVEFHEIEFEVKDFSAGNKFQR